MFDIKIVLYEYTEILLGKRKNFSINFFDGKEDEENAITFVRSVAKTFLGCNNLRAAQATITPNVLSKMKLDSTVIHIKRPRFILREDKNDYILAKIFTDNFDSERWIANRLCKRIQNGTLTKYPKFYMNEYAGLKRSQYCLHYFLITEFTNKKIIDLYRFSASLQFTQFLRQRLLLNVKAKFYSSPVEYLHESMDIQSQEDAYFHLYDTLYKLGFNGDLGFTEKAPDNEWRRNV